MNLEKGGPEIDVTGKKQIEKDGVIEFVDYPQIVLDIRGAVDMDQLFKILLDNKYPKGLIGDIKDAISWEKDASKFELERSGRDLRSARNEDISDKLAGIDSDVVDALKEKVDALMELEK